MTESKFKLKWSKYDRLFKESEQYEKSFTQNLSLKNSLFLQRKEKYVPHTLTSKLIAPCRFVCVCVCVLIISLVIKLVPNS